MRDQILPDEIENDGDAAPSLPPLTVPDSDDDERSIEVDAFLEDHQDVESIPEVPTIIPASMASTIIFDGRPVEEEGELVAARRTGGEAARGLGAAGDQAEGASPGTRHELGRSPGISQIRARAPGRPEDALAAAAAGPLRRGRAVEIVGPVHGEAALSCVEIKIYGAFVLHRRVDRHAIDARLLDGRRVV